MRSSIFKALAASAFAVMAATSAASAADLAARPYTKAPVMEPIYISILAATSVTAGDGQATPRR